MRRALKLAAGGRGWTSPNPMVGAVVVRDGSIVGEGYHEAVGGPHAEVHALRNAGEQARGATLYVTLEPCNHQGRTPPCTRAVLEAGVAGVVIGMSDPNPRVEGGGADFLRSRGVAVETGVLETECRLLNQAFIKHITTGMPLVVIKAAATLDGRIATRTRDSKWISNERSRRFSHELRCDLDAVLVGIETVLSDDPELTARLRRRPPCRQPVRIVLDTHLRLPLQSRLVKGEVPLWVACGEDASVEREESLAGAGVTILRMDTDSGRVDLKRLLMELGARGVTSVLVEGGSRVHGAFLAQGLVDEFHFFYAPKVLCDSEGVPMISGVRCDLMSGALPAYGIRVRRFGEDVLLSGRFRERPY